MKADLLFSTKENYKHGFIEMKIWRVPEPVPPSEHPYKYSLVCIVNNERVIGYDNERGKGDRKHIRGEEIKYKFVSIRTVVEDFKADIERVET